MSRNKPTHVSATQSKSRARFKTVAIINNLKVIVPPIYFVYEDSAGQKKSVWKAGILDRFKKKVEPLGFGQPAITKALNRRLKNSEVVFYQTSHQQDGLIINKSFFNIGPADFGRAICCQAEIKEKIIGEKRYTEISFSKTNSRWKRALDISGRQPGTEQAIKIKNSTAFINIFQLRKR